MRNSILAVLMTATALVPGTAMAQRDDNGDRGSDRQARLAAQIDRPVRAEPQPQPSTERPANVARSDRGNRPDRGDGGQRSDGGADRRGSATDWGGAGRPERFRPAAPVPPVAQVNPVPQQRGDRGELRGNRVIGADVRGNRGSGDWRNDDRRPGNVRNDGNRPGQWRGNDNRNDARNYDRNPNRNDARNWRGNDRRDWNRNWRQDNRYDWSRRRQVNRNAFNLPRYYAPYGWNYGYRRFNIGIRLSSILFAQNYWIDDADYYGLPEAYGPYRWVRYYNDALLIDIYTGQVVDTVYDIFW